MKLRSPRRNGETDEGEDPREGCVRASMPHSTGDVRIATLETRTSISLDSHGFLATMSKTALFLVVNLITCTHFQEM